MSIIEMRTQDQPQQMQKISTSTEQDSKKLTFLYNKFNLDNLTESKIA